MKIRFIEECNQDNILMETGNTEILNAAFGKDTQIQITKENEILICEYNYNVLKVLENEIDIYVTIADEVRKPSKRKKLLKKNLFANMLKED